MVIGLAVGMPLVVIGLAVGIPSVVIGLGEVYY